MQHEDHKNQSQYWIENREESLISALFFFVSLLPLPISRKQSNLKQQQKKKQEHIRIGRARDKAGEYHWTKQNSEQIPHNQIEINVLPIDNWTKKENKKPIVQVHIK